MMRQKLIGSWLIAIAMLAALAVVSFVGYEGMSGSPSVDATIE